VHVIIKNVLLNTKTPKVLAGGLALLLVFEWGLGVRDARQLERATEPSDPPRVKIAEPVKQVKQHKAERVDFFGEYTPDGVGNVGVLSSNVKASISGILYSSDEKSSQVLLDIPGHIDNVFKVGDAIPGGAIIKRIKPEGIILMRGEVMESLSLPKNTLNFDPPAQPMGER